ncbi:MAG: hypothetical protein LAO20_10880 [Acidobacteriia bacterium]|nr:hypothetical protein [Terriglobia bacterium]
MTTGKLYALLSLLEAAEKKLQIQSSLDAIETALTDLTSSPAEPQHQEALADALASLEASAPKLRDAITPTQAVDINAMGGGDFFDPAMSNKVKNAVQTNAMTPSVARDYVQDLTSKRAGFLETVRGAIKNLKTLKLQEAPLETGSADIAFLIPRDIFSNHIGLLAKELSFINRLVEHVSEAVTGEVQPAVLQQLSSSDPTVAVLAAVPVILAIGKVVDMFLDSWKKFEEIRTMRAKLSDMGLKGRALEELTEHVETSIDELVEESTKLVLTGYSKDGRKSELENGVRTDIRRLFGQIERGLKVEIHVNTENKEGTDQNVLSELETLSSSLTFPEPAKHPVLLSSGEILEGEFTVTKKTTTQKKTVAKKTVAHADRNEPKATS